MSVSFADNLPTPPSPSEEKTEPKVSAPHPNLPLNDGKFHLLLAASGSVASIKIPLIVEKLYRIYEPSRISIQIVVTSSAERFLPAADKPLPAAIRLWRDSDEWTTWGDRSDPIVHIELRRWAHLLLIAPLSANTLAKISGGLCDNLLTSAVRAWNPAVPILLAPAMNTYMYNNPITKRQLRLISDEMPWIEVLKPVEKVLACGDIGMGGMREWSDIVEIVVSRFPPSSFPRKSELQPLVDENGLTHEKQHRNHPPTGAAGELTGHIRFEDELEAESNASETGSEGRPHPFKESHTSG
ncbi:flavoprotein [Myxozyma melibiosi]|uniref:Flavoprotein n=1 Tax=Myxozyma melibiosi TaxID=54550 RepID=A0ABR1FAW3_9ASCO